MDGAAGSWETPEYTRASARSGNVPVFGLGGPAEERACAFASFLTGLPGLSWLSCAAPCSRTHAAWRR